MPGRLCDRMARCNGLFLPFLLEGHFADHPLFLSVILLLLSKFFIFIFNV